MSDFATDLEWKEDLLNQKSFLDVRAEVEYNEGHLPHALNHPILNNDERHLIGIEYKNNGQDAAIRLGHQIVSAENREKKLKAWLKWSTENPEGILYCFRGGQRSQITQTWLKENGRLHRRIKGGYKYVRNFLIEESQRQILGKTFLVLGGLTGTGKSKLLHHLPKEHQIDLEFLANHKGSSFGAEVTPQPAQAQFENELTLALIQTKKLVLIENESRLVGKNVLPLELYEQITTAPLIILSAPFEERVKNIYFDYVSHLFEQMKNYSPLQSNEVLWNQLYERHQQSLNGIQKKLGGLRFSEVSQSLKVAFNKNFHPIDEESHAVWIKQLLHYYYDPLYEKHKVKNKDRILKEANFDELRHFLTSQFAGS